MFLDSYLDGSFEAKKSNMMSIYSVVPHDATLESSRLESPCPSGEESQVETKMGGGDSQQSLLPMSFCSHGLALTSWLLPVHP